MDAKTFDKARLPSRHVTEGPERAPHRSYYYAMGLSRGQIHQPFVGVATCWNEAAPCNIALARQAVAHDRCTRGDDWQFRETLAAIDEMRMSRLRTWDSSWARTPSNSVWSMRSRIPVVTATAAFDGLRPVAKAFGWGDSIR